MSDDTIVSPDGKQWSVSHRSWCVKRYFEVRSYVKIQAEFLHVFETMKALAKRQLYLWKSHFEKFGTVEILNSKSANRESYSGEKESEMRP